MPLRAVPMDASEGSVFLATDVPSIEALVTVFRNTATTEEGKYSFSSHMLIKSCNLPK